MKPFRQRSASLCLTLAVSATSARADIFQWEYIDPADPSQGKQQSATLAPDGAGVDAVPGSDLSFRNLSMAYLKHADLTDANLYGAALTEADVSGAIVRQANFGIHPGSCSGYACFWPIGTGISLAQLYSTASYKLGDLSGIGLSTNNLIDASFVGQNLTNAHFNCAALDSADFSDAVIERADFTALSYSTVFQTGITLSQLYNTASYKNKSLRGVGLSYNNLSGGNFAGQNLADANFYFATLVGADFGNATLINASFVANLRNTNLRGANLANASFATELLPCSIFSCQYADLTGADLTAADARGAYRLNAWDATTANLIRPDGHISGLDLDADELLIVRDYDGNPSLYPAPTDPIPITVDQHLSMAPGGTLRLVFEADAWDSTISFAPGIPITLGGTLELTFADDVNLASQIGRTFDLFDWTGVSPTGAFAISSRYGWDTSNLYTTGEVTLVAVPEASSGRLLIAALFALAFHHRRTNP